jgi:hypothetical protein
MLKPGDVSGIETVRWSFEGKRHAIPSIFHTAWQAPDGRFAVVLANWTSRMHRVRVRDSRLGQSGIRHVVARRVSQARWRSAGGSMEVSVPPLSMVLLERR